MYLSGPARGESELRACGGFDKLVSMTGLGDFSAEVVTQLAFDARSGREFRREVMRRLMHSAGADWAIFSEQDTCLEQHALLHLDAFTAEAARRTVVASPHQLARGNRRIVEHGAIVDTNVYSRREWESLPHVAEHQRHAGVTSNLIIGWLDPYGSPVFLNVGRSQGQFTQEQEVAACRLRASLAVADHYAHLHTQSAPVPVSPTSALSERQAEILAYVAQGLTNRQIAGACSISVYTVRNHLVRLFEQYRVRTRTELALKLSCETAKL